MIDFNKIKKLYKLGQSLTWDDVQVLLKHAQKRKYKPGELVIDKGDTAKEIYFIRKGLIRNYVVNDKGDEITTMVRWEYKVIASPEIILFDEPSDSYFEALEVTEVFCMDYDKLQTLIANNPKLESNRKNALLNIIKEMMQRINSFVLLTPEERYLEFVKQKPNIVNRVPDKYIAHILGITPVSLSRIRKRIVSKKS